jgi:hypothetical protein
MFSLLVGGEEVIPTPGRTKKGVEPVKFHPFGEKDGALP